MLLESDTTNTVSDIPTTIASSLINTRYTRTGREVELLSSMDSLFPLKISIEGEIWFGRDNFTLTYSLLKSSADVVSWQYLRMISFDITAQECQSKTFEQRYKILLAATLNENFNISVSRVLCRTAAQLHKWVEDIMESGGEGAILRKPGSLYEHGKSQSLLKIKTFFGDREGIVVACNEDKSVKLKLPQGQTFIVPPQNVLIPKPSIGDVVTFSFERHSRSDEPVNPKIYRIRGDLSWEEVVYNYAKEAAQVKATQLATNQTKHNPAKNMRRFMEVFAQRRNMDPLFPSTWYTISYKDIRKSRGGRTILQKFKGHYNALQSLFPEIGLDSTDFQQSWHEAGNRRKFFERFAKENGFDYLIPSNWYSQNIERIMATKGATNVVSYHNSISQALIGLFPEVQFDQASFWRFSKWHGTSGRRKFFETYARETGFDPLIAENWYSQPNSQIMATKGITGIISYHDDSVSRALLDLFPEIGLDKSKLRKRSHWYDPRNRRSFFEQYAKGKGFDPLLSHHWYSQAYADIIAAKDAIKVLSYHKNSVTQALLDLFPNVGLDRHKLCIFSPPGTR